MGIDLVRLTLLRYAASLSGRAAKVLLFMAATALDKPTDKGQPPGLYFAGELPLVHVLYGQGADPTRNRVREVRRVLAELVEAGLIARMVDAPGKGSQRRQCFRLNVALGGESAHPLDGQSAHLLGGESAPQWVGNLPTPRTHEDTRQDSFKDSSTSFATEPQTARASHNGWTTEHEFNDDGSGASCGDCGLVPNHPRHQMWRSA